MSPNIFSLRLSLCTPTCASLYTALHTHLFPSGGYLPIQHLHPTAGVPKMSVGAICLTSSGSNGGCRVILVIFLVNLFFSLKKGFFFIRDLHPPQNKCTRVMPQNSIAFGSAPRREADSQPISQLVRQAVSQTVSRASGRADRNTQFGFFQWPTRLQAAGEQQLSEQAMVEW